MSGHYFQFLILILCLAKSHELEREYQNLWNNVEDKLGLEAIRNLHQQLDDDNFIADTVLSFRDIGLTYFAFNKIALHTWYWLYIHCKITSSSRKAFNIITLHRRYWLYIQAKLSSSLRIAFN